ncbi:MAG TPA: PKD domain-containing protein, partial [Chitinophagales bacterium]|nr:PKD domain-containing protein [Chitinophagales bacterium]
DNKTIYLCKGDTFKVDLKTPAGFSVLWNTGDNTPQLNITQSGQYTVKVTDAIGCFVFDTINVIVDEPTLSPVPDAGNNLTLCEGEKLFLTTATAFDSILWSNGSTENFIAVTNPGNYNVYGITSSGCVINQPINITIAGKAPTALFAVPPACQDAPLTFTDTSKVPAGNTIQNWSWTFSNNSTSTIQNPTTLFSSLGTQTVTLKITTNVGCTDSIAKTFTVNRKPVPSFFNLLSCAGNATTFVDQSIANAASLINWKWDFGGLGTSNGIQNPAFRFPDATNYTVKLVATNSNFCSDSITLPVAVNPSPVSDFSFDSVCGRSPISYKFLATVTSPSTITAWNWNFGDGEAETAIRNPQHAYDEPGIYEVSLAVRSSNQCTDTIVKSVRIFDFPTVDFEVSSAQCVGKEIQFTDISTTPDGSDITKWTWYFAGLATSSQQNPRYQFNAEGNYTVQLTATNEVGCSGTKQRSVAVSSLPQPKFTFTPANGLPPLNVSFTNQSPVSGSYVWDYGDGTAPVAAYNPPTHIYTVKGSYPIKLIGTDFRGCVDTLTRYILVDKAYLDGVIAAVILIPNGNFYKVQVTLQNNSNIEITSAGLGLQLGGGAILRETWNGSLLPGRSATFLFTGEVSAGEAQAPVICATIENLNSYAPEDRTDNNTTCKELSVGDFEVFSIYPNPALENINLGVMLPQDGTVSIRLIDYLGQQLNMITFSGIKGYNNFTVNTAALGASVYIAEVAYKDQIIRKKFVRGNSK